MNWFIKPVNEYKVERITSSMHAVKQKHIIFFFYENWNYVEDSDKEIKIFDNEKSAYDFIRSQTNLWEIINF